MTARLLAYMVTSYALGWWVIPREPALGASSILFMCWLVWFVGCVDDLYRRTRCRGSP